MTSPYVIILLLLVSRITFVNGEFQMSESEAIERAKLGDTDAIDVLYHLHQRRVHSLCFRMTADRSAADELTQDVFLQLFRKVRTFRGESALSTWLHRVAVNLVLMRLRKRHPPLIALEQTPETEKESHEKELGAEDLRLALLLDRLRLESAINDLPLGYRTVFVLHDVEGYEHHEIAEKIGCSISNSKSQLRRARMRLRKLLTTSREESSREVVTA